MESLDESSNDVINDTMKSIRVKNDYQDTGFVDLIIRANIRRRFREWSLTIPREHGTKNRIRSPWTYLSMNYDNTSKNSIVVHDMEVSYTQY